MEYLQLNKYNYVPVPYHTNETMVPQNKDPEQILQTLILLQRSNREGFCISNKQTPHQPPGRSNYFYYLTPKHNLMPVTYLFFASEDIFTSLALHRALGALLVLLEVLIIEVLR